MKKLTLALVALFLGISCILTAQEKILRDQKIPAALIVPKKPVKGVTGKKWLANWGLVGKADTQADKLTFSRGLIYSWSFRITNDKPATLKVIVNAAALKGKKASIGGYVSGCCRAKGEKKPFVHEKKIHFKVQKIAEGAAKDYVFTAKLDPRMMGYVYLDNINVEVKGIKITLAQ